MPYGASPLLSFKLRVTNTGPEESIHTVVLRAQIQIEVTRRHYTQRGTVQASGPIWRAGSLGPNSAQFFVDPRDRGGPAALPKRPLVELQVPCTFDFNVAATKYFHGLVRTEIYRSISFSAARFFMPTDQDQLQVAPISWEKEAKFKLPLKTWKDLIDHYYPNSAWLYLRRDVFDRLYQYKVRHGIPTWEQVIERVLAATEETVQL